MSPTMQQRTVTGTDSEWLFRVATRLAGDQDAEDVAQQTWLAAHEHPPDDSRPRRPWLRVVARRVALMARRRRARWSANAWRLEHEPPSEAPETDLHRARILSAVKAALDELGESDRDIVVRRFFLDQGNAQVAQELGLQPGAVRTRLSRALGRVRVTLDRDFGGREKWAGGLLFPWRHSSPAVTQPAWVGLGLLVLGLAAFAFTRPRDDDDARPPQAEASAAIFDLGASPTPDSRPVAPSPPPRDPQVAAWETKRSAILDAHRRQDDDIDREAPQAPALALSSSGATTDFKRMAAELQDVTAECIGPPTTDAAGTLKLDVHIIADPDIGAIVDQLDVRSDGVGDPELVDCLTQSIPAFHVPSTQARLDQDIEVRIDIEQRTIALHTWLMVDDLPAYLRELEGVGMPPEAVEKRRQALEDPEKRKIRTGWLMKYDEDPQQVTP